MEANPFVPGFGKSPPVLAGRRDVLGQISRGLDAGPGHPEYASILTGPRGSGKTVALNEVQRIMEERGWLAVAITVTPRGAFLADVERRCRRLLTSLLPGGPRRTVTALQLPVIGGGITWEVTRDTVADLDLRDLLASIGVALAAGETGLLITVDEMHLADLSEVQEFGAVVQHVAMREGQPIAFAAAALPQLEESLQASVASTFLQRCSWHELGAIPIPDVAEALRATIEQAGRRITPAALAYAARMTSGYAFMVQLVGFHTWEAAGDAPELRMDDARRGAAEATAAMGRQVFLPQWRALSGEDRRMLLAIAEDDGDSRVSDIRARVGKGSAHVGVYRDRLIKGGWVRPAGRGLLAFTHEAARDWLRTRGEVPPG